MEYGVKVGAILAFTINTSDMEFYTTSQLDEEFGFTNSDDEEWQQEFVENMEQMGNGILHITHDEDNGVEVCVYDLSLVEDVKEYYRERIFRWWRN